MAWLDERLHVRPFHLALGVSSLLLACGPPQLTLAQITSAKLVATRDGTAPVKATLSWDLTKTPCGPITGLIGKVDAVTGTVTNSAPKGEKDCEWPTLTVPPMSATTDRVIAFEDGATSISVSVTTIDAARASAVTMSHTLRVGDSVVWTFSGTGGDVGPWRIFYTPTGGAAEQQWANGTGPIQSVGAMIPASASNTSGTVGLQWSALAMIRACNKAVTCEVNITDRAAFAVSVTP